MTGFSMLMLGLCLSTLIVSRHYRKTNFKEPLRPKLKAWQLVFGVITAVGAVLVAISRFGIA